MISKKLVNVFLHLSIAAILFGILSGCSSNQDVPNEVGEDFDSIYRTELESLPVFVGKPEDCIDMSKQYVLPDGKIWSYESITYTTSESQNQIPLSIDTDGTPVGLIEGFRYNSSDTLEEQQNVCATGFIPVSAGDTLRFDGIQFQNNTIHEVSPGAIYIRFYDSNFMELTNLSALVISERVSNVAVDYLFDEDGNISCMKLNDSYPYAYIRLSFIPENDCEAIITVNEEINSETSTYQTWVPRDYIPEAWYSEVMDTISSVKKISASNSIQFLFNSDIHLEPNGSNYDLVDDIGKVSAGVMQACNIPFFMNTGDSTTQSSGYALSDLQANMEMVLGAFEPVPQGNILLTVGNHDGATGQAKINGETVHYQYQLSNQDRANLYFGWQRTNAEKVFGPDGSYYYFDDSVTKTRYIMLNSFWSEYAGDENGFTADVNHSFFHAPLLGQEQLNWFAHEALALLDGYAAIIGTHNAFSPLDDQVLREVIDAYVNRTACSSSYTGAQEWQNSSVSADYSDAKGEIIAIFQGHNHKDILNTQDFAVPCITITTAGGDVRDEMPVERVADTAVETAIDVVTIDRTKHIIYLTRLGAGEDRVVKY